MEIHRFPEPKRVMSFDGTGLNMPVGAGVHDNLSILEND
jgi:hypothetical protein